MQTKAIVLHYIKYQDTNIIVKCYTEQNGIVSYFVRNAFSKSNKKWNIAYFQPLTLLEISATHKKKGTLEYISDLKLYTPYESLTSDFSKCTIAMFLGEFLTITIQENQEDNNLFAFLETAFIWFDQNDFFADFHLVFLKELTKYLGFYPDDSCDGIYFSPKEGIFTNLPSDENFDEDETFLLKKLLQHSFQQRSIFRQIERRTLLDLLQRYYQYHVYNFKETKSLTVLKELF